MRRAYAARMKLAGQDIAVTGATGFLGGYLCEELLARGAAVRGVVRSPTKGAWLAGLGVRLEVGELGDEDSLVEAFRGADAVVANAALSVRGQDPPLRAYEEANVEGCARQLRAASRAGVRRVILVSSIAVYRVRLWTKIAEDHEQVREQVARWGLSRLTTNWKYSVSKQRGEARAWELAEELGLELTALRPGPIYGGRDHKLTAEYRARLGGSVALAPTMGLPHVHAADVAVACGGALDDPISVGRAYNVAGPRTSPFEALTALGAALGSSCRVLPIPVPLWVEFDDSAATRDLGYRPRSVVEGMLEVASVVAA